MRFLPLMLLVACARTAVPVRSSAEQPDRLVLAGELTGLDSLTAYGADGRNYRVSVENGRFAVAVPAGVYEIGGQTVSGIPGDVLYIGSFRVERGALQVFDAWATFDRTGLPAAPRCALGTPSLFAGSAHRRSGETPGRSQLRTGQPARPLPGPGRAGQGIGLRSR